MSWVIEALLKSTYTVFNKTLLLYYLLLSFVNFWYIFDNFAVLDFHWEYSGP